MQILKNIALLVAGIFVAAALSEGAARVLFPQWPEFQSSRFMHHQTVTGHAPVMTGVPGFDGHFAQNDGDFRVRVTINDFGLRNAEPVTKSDGRIWVVGDSFAFGWGVEADEMMSAHIRAGDMPAYNVASPGADACGYRSLIGRMPETVHPRAVVVVLTVENDINVYECRGVSDAPAVQKAAYPSNLTDAKGMLIEISALYNLIAIAIKKSPLLRDLLVDAGVIARAHGMRTVPNPEEAARRIDSTARQLAALRESFPTSMPFSVFLVPARFEVRDGDTAHANQRTKMAAALRDLGIDVIDPIDAFVSAGFANVHFAHDGHWSPQGHLIAANAVNLWLKQRVRP